MYFFLMITAICRLVGLNEWIDLSSFRILALLFEVTVSKFESSFFWCFYYFFFIDVFIILLYCYYKLMLISFVGLEFLDLCFPSLLLSICTRFSTNRLGSILFKFFFFCPVIFACKVSKETVETSPKMKMQLS